MASTDTKCVLCGVADDNIISTLGEKGCKSVISACGEKGHDVKISPGQAIHPECRKSLCHPNYKRKQTSKVQTEASISNQRTSRVLDNFDFKTKCLFCATSAVHNKGKRKRAHDVHPVLTLEFQKSIKTICTKRNDRWSNIVLGRIEFANDLPAVEARYHQTCCSNFRSGFKVPQQFQSNDLTGSCVYLDDDDSGSKPKKGRPFKESAKIAFEHVLQYFEENDSEQLTINDMVKHMENICGEEAYSNVYMKKRILEHYGSSVIITEINGKSNVVTFKSKGHAILYQFYNRSKIQDNEAEKLSIIQTAAKLISSDIQAIETSKEYYPSPSTIRSHDENMEFVPKSLRTFMKQIIDFKGSETVISSLGQAIIQSAMPRKIIAPLQIGLAVQLHFHFGSKFLIEILNSMGFCSSYKEVQKYETSAALTLQPTLEKSEGQFLQFVGDNVDHNLAPIDGHNTFHGMGVIATMTPKKDRNIFIRRVKASPEDLIEVGKINIKPYRPLENSDTTGMGILKFKGNTVNSQNTFLRSTIENLDFLVGVTRSLGKVMPAWSGVMQTINKGTYPGQSDILFLPLIDLNPSDMSCIYSTLLYVANESKKIQINPVITFDQPLFWKAFSIVENEPTGSILKDTVVRLGGFHTQMSFLGCIGHLMENSGLTELLSTVYAPNTVVHMMNGKAVSRAIRGHFLVNDALEHLVNEKSFPEYFQNPESDNNLQSDIQSTQSDANAERKRETIDHPLIELMEKTLCGTIDQKELEGNQLYIDMKKKYEDTKESIKEGRTGLLWLQYMDMIKVMKMFIAAERTGNWIEHTESLKSMLPYFAASGHNLYLKSSLVYLQKMASLPHTNPNVYKAFEEGNHVIRRSDKFWAGLSTDLTIEQTLMRSIKSVGGMTRGRGMSEVQRAQWILSMPACASVNSSMQEVTSTSYHTSEQHKESKNARIQRDDKDRSKFVDFLRERNPFNSGKELMNIDTGVYAENNVNVDMANGVGDKIISEMENKLVSEYKFKRTNQVVTMGARTHVKVNGEECAIDPQLLFQRLVTISDNTLEDTEELFKYELSTYPSALFDSCGFLREPQKSLLASAIWDLGNCAADTYPKESTVVLDGGSLLQRVSWNFGDTFDQICEGYCQYIRSNNYKECHVVFDGYPNTPTTKDAAHERRAKGKGNVTISFNPTTPCKTKKDIFLANQDNKKQLIVLLSSHLSNIGCKVHYAEEDADLLIVITAVEASAEMETVVIGEDTDLLVLLCYHASPNFHRIFFKSDISTKRRKIWDICATKNILGENMCTILPVIHAFSGCDTVSRIFGIGKAFTLKKAIKDMEFRKYASVFISETNQNEIEQAGEKLVTSLYGGHNEQLDRLRYRLFQQKVCRRNTVVSVQSLPPTASAMKYHSFRSYSQIQFWIHGNNNPEEWGWTVKNEKMTPVMCDLPPAPARLLKVIKCNCHTNCDSRRCSCRKHGLFCSVGCGHCKGTSCSNIQHMEDEADQDVL